MFAEVVRVLSLDYGIQNLACVETIPRQLHRIIVVNHLVLVRTSTGFTVDMEQLTRTRARMVLTALKTNFAGEASTALLFSISILSSRNDNLALDVRVAIVTWLGEVH